MTLSIGCQRLKINKNYSLIFFKHTETMPLSCAVPFCFERKGGHRFPHDKDVREKWLIAIGRVGYKPSKYSIVCRSHFFSADYTLPKESTQRTPMPVLKKNAVPSRFSWNNGKISSTCSVPQCESRGVTYKTYPFPKNKFFQKKWIELLKIGKAISNKIAVCELHFNEDDFVVRGGSRLMLKTNAVPSQLLPKLDTVNATSRETPSVKLKKLRKMIDSEEASENVVLHQCRACLTRFDNASSLSYIFQGWSPPIAGMAATIAEDLAVIANIEVLESDNFPKMICYNCYQQLLDAALFIGKVRYSDHTLRQRSTELIDIKPEIDTEKKWPQPIQIDKNVNENVYENSMEVEVKQEVISDEECDTNLTESYMGPDLINLDIKVEPEEILEPPPMQITINALRKSTMNNEDENIYTFINQPVLVPCPDSDSMYCRSETNNPGKKISGTESEGSWVMPIRKKVKQFLKRPVQHTDEASTSSPTVLRPFIDTHGSSSETVSSGDEIVCKKGFRKQRLLPKPLRAKSERRFGKGKKIQPNPCAGKKCGNKCETNFSDDDRRNIHELYWALGSSLRRRNWLLSLIEETNVQRRTVGNDSRRSISYRYYFPWGEGEVKRVCQQFLLKTLGISQMTLRNTLKIAAALKDSNPDERIRS